MNEVAIHRGRYPHLSVVDAYVDGQHLTEAVVSLRLSIRIIHNMPPLTLMITVTRPTV